MEMNRSCRRRGRERRKSGRRTDELQEIGLSGGGPVEAVLKPRVTQTTAACERAAYCARNARRGNANPIIRSNLEWLYSGIASGPGLNLIEARARTARFGSAFAHGWR
eukprot:7562104-Alexandrium_andersonii.AAC.1